MNGIFLNVVLHLMNYWFSSAYTLESFSLFSKIQIIDSLLYSIKLPHDFPKFPEISTFSNWKAAELR